MKVKIFGAALTAIVLFSINQGLAQSYAESAMQFSRSTPGGSARIQAIGGSQIALGGDYSSALSNPAGLGLYNKSEITFSPGFSSLTTKADYLGDRVSDVKTKLVIPGLSFVFNFPREDGDFLGGSLAISFTRINDFNQSISYRGRNEDNSIIDSFLDKANGDDISQFDEGEYNYNTATGLGYYNYLIGPQSILNPPGSNSEYFTDVKGIPLQRENIQTTGASNQWSFSYGANLKDKLFLGAGLGLTTMRYRSSKIYDEDFADDEYFNGLTLEENLNIQGSGVNLTLGIMGRPVDFIQIGASYKTPTVYQLSETYDASMSSSWKNDLDYYGDGEKILADEYAETDIVKSDYVLVVPSKLSTGVAFISKYGFITGDLEFTNIGGARYSSAVDGVSFSDNNSEIKSNYKRVLNYRFGAEFRYNVFRARAGYGVQANTYSSTFRNNNSNTDNNEIRSVSGGVGIRAKKFFVDFTLVFSEGNNLYFPYSGAPAVTLTNSLTKGIITAGFNF
jgi:hypothetical protein